MTDNRATEPLRKLLDERGVEHEDKHTELVPGISEWDSTWWRGIAGMTFLAVSDESVGHEDCIYINGAYLTPEQAIAATIGSELPYDKLLRCLETDWYIRATWDGLRKFWCIELTEEGVKLRDAELGSGTLTAEQVRETVEKHWHDLSAEYDMPEATALPEYSYDWQAIADELNATLGRRTCHNTSRRLDESRFCCSECWFGCWVKDICDGRDKLPNYCPNCGREVER